MQCPFENCGCGANDHIPKFLNIEEAKTFVSSLQERQQSLLQMGMLQSLIKAPVAVHLKCPNCKIEYDANLKFNAR